MRVVGYLIAFIMVVTLCGLISFFLIIATANPRVTNERDAEKIKEMHLYELARKDFFPGTLPPIVEVTVKPQLDAKDALVNVLFVFVMGLSAFLFMLFAGVFLFFKGLFTGSWTDLIFGVLAIVGSVLVPFGFWINFMFQYGTPAYYLIMIPGGIVAAPAGLLFGAAGPIAGPQIILNIFIRFE